MTDAREDNEIVGAPDAKYLEPEDSGDGYIVNMERESAFRPDALPAAGVPAELAPLMERVFLFLEDGEWAKADEYCEKVLDQAPRTPMAYLGKFMAEKHVRAMEDLTDVPIDLEGDRNYSKAVRFADPELAELLTRYALTGKSAIRRKRHRRILAMVLIPLAGLLLLTGVLVSVVHLKTMPEKTFAAEVAALENAAVGEVVTFGSADRPTEWQVLEKNGDELLLLSRSAVAMRQWSADSDDTTWAKSDIRDYLNNAFYESAFGKREQALIRQTTLDEEGTSPYASDSDDAYDEDDGYYYDDGEGIDFLSYAPEDSAAVTDRLFLLNLAEVNRYLKTDAEKRCLSPLPEKTKAAGEETPTEYTGWWLRPRSSQALPACYVDAAGAVQYDYIGEDPALGVRPAMWVDLGNRQ